MKVKTNQNNAKKPNRFYQFRKEDTPQILYLLSSHPLALRVFAILLYCADHGGEIGLGIVALKQKYIGQAVSNKSNPNNRSGVAKAIKYLENLGLIAIKKKDINNIYILNPEFVWNLKDTQESRDSIEKKVHFKSDPIKIVKRNKKYKKLKAKFDLASADSTRYSAKKLSIINHNKANEIRAKREKSRK